MNILEDLKPLTKSETCEARAALSLQLRIPGLLGIMAAEAAHILGYGKFDNAGGVTTLWGVGDPMGRVSEYHHLSGPPLPDDTVLTYGDTSIPAGASELKRGEWIVLVAGASNAIAAYQYFLDAVPDFMPKVVVMLGLEHIAHEELYNFRDYCTVLCDLGSPATVSAYAIWRQQISYFTTAVQNVNNGGWRFADGRPALNLLDVANITWEADRLSASDGTYFGSSQVSQVSA